MSTYKYATVMEARNSAGDIDAGTVHVIDGKKEDGHTDTFITDDNSIATVAYDRLKLIELPGRMTSSEIMDYLNDNFDDLLADVAPGGEA